MSKKTLYLMCGPAGAGKSTWVRKNAKPGVSAHISRDKVRFSMLKEGEHYFSREDDVYAEFCKQIGDALNCPWVEEVWADATHLTEKARKLLFDTIDYDLFSIKVIPVVIKPKLETILTQNAQRTGRENVPERVIRNMYNSFQDPWDDEIEYTDIIYREQLMVLGKIMIPSVVKIHK